MSSELFTIIMFVAGAVIGFFGNYFRDSGKENKKRDIEIAELKLEIHKAKGFQQTMVAFMKDIQKEINEINVNIAKLK